MSAITTTNDHTEGSGWPTCGAASAAPTTSAVPVEVYRRDLLGGLLHEYYQAAV